MIERAIVLAAGFGKRLQPLTNNVPKPLLKINDVTLLENTLIFLKKIGVKYFAVNTHYLSDKIKYFCNTKKNLFDIQIFHEPEILGTGGGIRNAIDFFKDENFISINSDTLWSNEYINPLLNLLKNFVTLKSKLGLLMVNKNKSFDKNLKGDFCMEKNSLYLSRCTGNNNNLIYTGCQIISPSIFKKEPNINFSVHKIWDQAISDKSMIGEIVDYTFYHATNLSIYEKLKKLSIKCW